MPIIVSFAVRRSDFNWMYVGSWGMWLAVAPGLLLLGIGLSGIVPPAIGLSRNTTVPVANYLFFVLSGLTALVAGPVYLCFLLGKVNRVREVVGRTVTLQIDDRGVWGWPMSVDLETDWRHMRRARHLGGVTALPFRKFGTRANWVPIPDRALTLGQQQALRALLASKGLA